MYKEFLTLQLFHNNNKQLISVKRCLYPHGLALTLGPDKAPTSDLDKRPEISFQTLGEAGTERNVT